MNKEEYKIEPIENGFKGTITFDMKDIKEENDMLLKEIDKINVFRIVHKEELQIRELLNRIDKAIEYIKKANYGTLYTIKGSKWYEILNILEGNNE